MMEMLNYERKCVLDAVKHAKCFKNNEPMQNFVLEETS